MATTRRDFLTLSLFSPNRQLAQTGLAQTEGPALTAAANDPILHLLKRITWGPRPDEVAYARTIGYEAFLDEQLNPTAIDDSLAEAMLAKKVAIFSLDRRALYQLNDSEWRTHLALIHYMVLAAAHSKRQLYERMVEFWADHFNIPSDDFSRDLILFQQDAIRPHALGNFRDLLIATAKGPAMLYYLDNYNNVVEAPNENYARELMELHTLGVDGGYSEQDVKAVARAFTGWTVHDGVPTGFYFNPEQHDTAPKVILGHQLPADRGIEDGLHVLTMLARHSATAYFICTKLCIRFVSDRPPLSLVERMVETWVESQGHIGSVLRMLFLSDEFLAAEGQKMRRPLDFFVGAMRAAGATIRDPQMMEEMLQDLGQVPYGWHPPNGYPDVAGAWNSTSGLLARWNVGMKLTHSAHSGRHVKPWEHEDSGDGIQNELAERIGEPQTVGELVDAVALQVFGAALDEQSRKPFIDYVLDSPESGTAELNGADVTMTPRLLGKKLGSLYGLMLVSPAYQWR